MTYAEQPIVRQNISWDLANAIREMIVDGRLPAGSAINEVHLARSMNVSRTPLREALSTLLAEGALVQIPRRGFFVRELTIEEARDIYMIRPVLDVEAFRLSGVPVEKEMARLQELIYQLRDAPSVGEAIRLDDEWHRVLWGRCPNKVLLELIEQFMLRTRRYELAYMGEPRIQDSSSNSKQRIVDSLKAGEFEEACGHLRRSLEGGLNPVLEWLAGRGLSG